jgi:hypothetical protein
MPLIQTRRHFLTGLSLAGATAFIRSPRSLAAEGWPETTTVRLAKKIPVLCNAPQYVADGLLRAEGFTEELAHRRSLPLASLDRELRAVCALGVPLLGAAG